MTAPEPDPPPELRESIVLTCGHLIDTPKTQTVTEMCPRCGAMYRLEHDRNGTWNSIHIAG